MAGCGGACRHASRPLRHPCPPALPGCAVPRLGAAGHLPGGAGRAAVSRGDALRPLAAASGRGGCGGGGATCSRHPCLPAVAATITAAALTANALTAATSSEPAHERVPLYPFAGRAASEARGGAGRAGGLGGGAAPGGGRGRVAARRARPSGRPAAVTGLTGRAARRLACGRREPEAARHQGVVTQWHRPTHVFNGQCRGFEGGGA